MNILHVSTNFHPIKGGLETFIADLALRQRTAGDDARVLCMNRNSARDPKLPANDEYKGIPVTRVGFIDLTFYKPTRLPIDLLKWATVIHVHVFGAHLDSVARLQTRHKRPFIVSCHGGIFHTSTLSTFKSIYARTILKRSLAKAAAVVASGPNDLRQVRAINPRAVRIPNGVQLGELLRLPRDRAEPKRLLFLGRLARNKRVDRLVGMMARLLSLDPQYRLAIVGADFEGLMEGLKRQSRLSGCDYAIEFVGEATTDRVREEIARAGIVVSSSQYEGFGLAVVEAMAGGCVPCLQSIEAHADLLGPYAASHTVDFEDASAAANKIVLLNRDIDFRTHASQFDWNQIFPRWQELYARAIQG